MQAAELADVEQRWQGLDRRKDDGQQVSAERGAGQQGLDNQAQAQQLEQQRQQQQQAAAQLRQAREAEEKQRIMNQTLLDQVRGLCQKAMHVTL